jgi:serine/threonine protein phosphatase PrpC
MNKNLSFTLLIVIFCAGSSQNLAAQPHTYGFAELQGRRATMEDAHNIFQKTGFELFGLYDGHGGSYVSKELASHLNYIIAQKFEELRPAKKSTFSYVLQPWTLSPHHYEHQIHRSLEMSYKLIHDSLDNDSAKNQGSTALTAVITQKNIIVANTGDSRAVLCTDGNAIALSVDHKPNRADEYERITALGGKVITYAGAPRVQGVLALSRAMGDLALAPYVICTPEIVMHTRSSTDQFLILACDGVWDVFSNQEAGDIVLTELKNSDANGAAQKLVQAAYDAGSTDNISAIVIVLQQ